MKGFIHLIEIAMAAIIIILSLVNFSYFGKVPYDRTNLIVTSDNIFNMIKGNMSLVDEVVPLNMKYGIKTYSYPKDKIEVCCNCSIDEFAWLKDNLKPIYYNGRNIDIELSRCSLDDFESYDVLFLVNYTDFSANKLKILNWTSHGKKVFAVNDAINNPDFLDIFGLKTVGSVNFAYDDFLNYDTRRLFQGIGYYIKLSYNPATGKYQGYWRMWNNDIAINKTGDYVEIENVGSVPEGGFFNMQRSDGSIYEFKVKKILTDEVWIQSVNTTRILLDFSDENINVQAKDSDDNLVGGVDSGGTLAQVTATKNGNAYWMSYYDYSDEYRALLKAGFLSMISDYSYGDTSGLSILNIISRCCDAPEVGRIDLILGYKY